MIDHIPFELCYFAKSAVKIVKQSNSTIMSILTREGLEFAELYRDVYGHPPSSSTMAPVAVPSGAAADAAVRTSTKPGEALDTELDRTQTTLAALRSSMVDGLEAVEKLMPQTTDVDQARVVLRALTSMIYQEIDAQAHHDSVNRRVVPEPAHDPAWR